MTKKTVFIFHLNISFDSWVYKFDFDEDLVREENNIKALFKVISKDNPNKVIVIAKTEESVLGKHIHENFDTFEQNGIDMNNALPSILY